MEAIGLSDSQTGEMVLARLYDYLLQPQIGIRSVERACINEGPYRNLVFVKPYRLRTDEILRAMVGQNWTLPGRDVSGPNSEFKAGRKWQSEPLHAPRRSAAIACNQRILGNGCNRNANKPVEVAICVDLELICTNVETVTVDSKMRKVRNSGTLLVRIVCTGGIKNVDRITFPRIGRLTDSEEEAAFAQRHTRRRVELRPCNDEPALRFRVEQTNRVADGGVNFSSGAIDFGRQSEEFREGQWPTDLNNAIGVVNI